MRGQTQNPSLQFRPYRYGWQSAQVEVAAFVGGQLFSQSPLLGHLRAPDVHGGFEGQSSRSLGPVLDRGTPPVAGWLVTVRILGLSWTCELRLREPRPPLVRLLYSSP